MQIGDDAKAIHDAGHRAFVGGNDAYWAAIAQLQYDMLLQNGLSPSNHFIDVACGSLRAGALLIPYLNPGRYTGVDKHIELIIYGVNSELGISAYRERQPHFIINDRFDFSNLATAPTFGIAQSLFSHLRDHDIQTCLANLRANVADGCRFFATFFEGPSDENPAASHSHGLFRYQRAQMEAFGEEAGWTPHYVGEWNHPRGQMLIEYRAA